MIAVFIPAENVRLIAATKYVLRVPPLWQVKFPIPGHHLYGPMIEQHPLREIPGASLELMSSDAISNFVRKLRQVIRMTTVKDRAQMWIWESVLFMVHWARLVTARRAVEPVRSVLLLGLNQPAQPSLAVEVHARGAEYGKIVIAK